MMYNHKVNIVVNDQLISYQRTGAGQVVLMLHGWGASLRSFKPLADELSRSYQVISLDFPGFGNSPAPQSSWSVSDYVDLVKHFLAKLRVKDCYAVIGHSFGGRVIIKGIGTGQLTPQRVILIDAAGIKPKDTIKSSVLASSAKAGKVILSTPGLNRFKDRLTQQFRLKFGSSDYQDANEMSEIFKKVVREDLTSYLPSIKQPTLLLWGEDDNETPLSDAKLMHSKIADSKLVSYPNAGHYVYLDELKQVTEKISGFLK